MLFWRCVGFREYFHDTGEGVHEIRKENKRRLDLTECLWTCMSLIISIWQIICAKVIVATHFLTGNDAEFV